MTKQAGVRPQRHTPVMSTLQNGFWYRHSSQTHCFLSPPPRSSSVISQQSLWDSSIDWASPLRSFPRRSYFQQQEVAKSMSVQRGKTSFPDHFKISASNLLRNNESHIDALN